MMTTSDAATSTGCDVRPLRLFRASVPPDWIDYNGHMTESRYLQCFGAATDTLLRRIGVDAAYLASGRSFFTVETHIMHRGQARLGESLVVATQVIACDPKRLHVFHVLERVSDEAILASAEQMLLHVDTAAERAISAEGGVLAAAEALARAHASLPRPTDAGRHVGAGRSP